VKNIFFLISRFASVLLAIVSVVSCGPSEEVYEGKDFVVTAPAGLEISNKSESKRGAMYSTLDLYDEKADVTYGVEVIYAMLNPQYLLEDYYGCEIESTGDGVYVAMADFGNVYSFNSDSCTIALTIPAEGELTFDDFKAWKVNHNNDIAAARCDHHPENDRPFLYEAYGIFSANIDYAITDDNISMESFKYKPEKNTIDVTVMLRNKTRDGYLAHRDENDEFILSRVKAFAEGIGLYYTYCRTKGADLKISVFDTFGEPLPVITAAL